MILLMDKRISVQATELRERILQKGLPCAASFSPFDTACLSDAHCILTFRSAYSIVRAYMNSDRYSHLPLLVVPDENQAVAFLAENSPAGNPIGQMLPVFDILLPYIAQEARQCKGVPGLILSGGFRITPIQVYFQITSLDLTEREKRVMQYFLFHQEGVHTTHQIAACALSTERGNLAQESEKIVSIISAINRKTDRMAGLRFLHRQGTGKEKGYYFSDKA